MIILSMNETINCTLFAFANRVSLGNRTIHPNKVLVGYALGLLSRVLAQPNALVH